MLGALKALGGVKWLPWAAAGLLATHGAAGVFFYSKGHSSATLAGAEQINLALQRQLEAERKLHKAQTRITDMERDRRQTIENAIDALPDSGAACDSDVWLREFNAPIEIINSTFGEPD